MAYPVEPWPEWMEGADGLWAKSLDKSAGQEAESLAMHTWSVLSRLADQYRLRPALADQLGEPRLWQRLFWACFLHDTGKAAAGFQQVLRGGERWPQRHEVLSLAFVGWLFPAGHLDREWVVAAVASHHKEPGMLYERYLSELDAAQEALAGLGTEVAPPVRVWLWRWLDECPRPWAEALGMAEVVDYPPLPSLAEAQSMFGIEAIHQALSEFDALDLRYEESYQTASELLGTVMLRGLIFTADHSASAHAPEFQCLPLTRENALGNEWGDKSLRDHQQAADQAERGSAILVAPTGSGKTEAALLWAARQAALDGIPPPRLFYALPYQASMNAMHKRLAERHFSEELVGLQHGRAVQSLYHDLLTDDDNTAQDAAEQARRKRELADLGIPPVRVFSPYQMLKAAYSLKGFEALLVDYHGGLFIFDEIHAYEPKRLALIVELVGWLARHFEARFLVMTATLPPTIEQVLREALPGCQTIEATEKVYQEARRHKVHLLEGDLLSEEGFSRVVNSVESGQSVLVCLNTVQRAMDMYHEMRVRLPELAEAKRIVLMHGRFNAEDRAVKEKLVQDYTRTGLQAQERQPTLVIATQVVEVSLDIDLDTLYTDPAPLEALLQRFGRVNRGREPGGPLADVHVFREPIEENKRVCGIYDNDLVRAGLKALEKLDNCPIDEAQVSGLLAEVYTGDIAVRWRAEYQTSADEFRRVALDGIRPFHSADESLASSFYKLFDGIEVLPAEMEDTYKQRRAEDYIEAGALFVPMSYQQYAGLERQGLAWPVLDKYCKPLYYLVDAHYNSETGLDLAEARKRAKAEFKTEDY